ncbi:TIM-barrel fold metal-dependent hydrolase [Deinococcus psychrotolerans]|uniref:Amidohydrolase family protein n=2 Tax=Deinococcus TaxID=1298 RepID=A0A553UFQ7_9DEIO|nr:MULTISPECIES: amidohydrolase family protein [Deinococcus]AZI44370.1 TIM-barrel fold metal-dependent hydrolase [Deinococcus psychrotolerans]TSA79045.1 amidohydrolase family protein [Deinococcus detaillensis]
MKIIDAHVHYGHWDRLTTRGAEDGFLEEMAEVCEQVGIVKIGLLANPGRGNDALARALEQRPDLVIAMGRLDLDRDPVSTVEDFYQRGFHGIKVIGVSKNYDDEAYYPFYEQAQARGLRILFHTGILGGPVDYLMGAKEDAWKAPPEGEAEEKLVQELGRQIRTRPYGFSSARMQPIYLDTIAFYFPELFMIGAHLGWPDYRTACAIARWRPRLYFDVSGGDVVHHHIVEGGYIGREISPRKLVYGSDSDLNRIAGDVKRWRDAFDAMGLSADDQEQIFYRNAAHIFGIGGA